MGSKEPLYIEIQRPFNIKKSVYLNRLTEGFVKMNRLISWQVP